jgi:hypothetical protein
LYETQQLILGIGYAIKWMMEPYSDQFTRESFVSMNKNVFWNTTEKLKNILTLENGTFLFFKTYFVDLLRDALYIAIFV